MYYADEKQLIDMWRFEEQFPFGGWELMHLDGRWESEPLPWDYREEVLMRLKDTDMLLDMDTGDGGFLLSLRHPYELTCATESDERDYESCVEQLAPLGIRTMFCNVDEEELPFEDDMFDMVLSRHGGYMIEELFRVLKPGGVFCGCFYGAGECARTDRFIRRAYEPMKFFTPPYETVYSLRDRLSKLYAQAEVGNVKSIAWFVCRKGSEA